MSGATWQPLSAECCELYGHLDRDSVPALWRTLQQWQPQAENVEWSLKAVNRIDSAGMVMLIHLIEHAKKQNCHIMLSFVPVELNTLFQLSNIRKELAGHIKN